MSAEATVTIPYNEYQELLKCHQDNTTGGPSWIYLDAIKTELSNARNTISSHRDLIAAQRKEIKELKEAIELGQERVIAQLRGKLRAAEENVNLYKDRASIWEKANIRAQTSIEGLRNRLQGKDEHISELQATTGELLERARFAEEGDKDKQIAHLVSRIADLEARVKLSKDNEAHIDKMYKLSQDYVVTLEKEREDIEARIHKLQQREISALLAISRTIALLEKKGMLSVELEEVLSGTGIQYTYGPGATEMFRVIKFKDVDSKSA